MNIILITTLVIAVIGVCVGAGLVFTGKKFAVEVDEREVAVREKLPGNNCGACGFAGCDALAAAIAKGEAPVNACPVGGAPVAQEIGDIMGTSAGAMERKVAFVACKGTCNVTKNQGNYVGIKDCRTASERCCRCKPEPLRQLRPVRQDLPEGPDLPGSGKPDHPGAVLQQG